MASDPQQTLIQALPQLPGVAPAGPGEASFAVTSPAGVTYQVPASQVLEAMTRGFQEADPSKLAALQTGARIAEEQAGVLPALLTGVEAGASALTFGATDFAAKKIAGLTGMSEEEYERRRAERMVGSPLAESIGTIAGIALPALLTEGLSVAATGATTAAKAVAVTPVGLAMRAGRIVGETAERLLPAATTTGQAIVRTGAQRALAGAVEGALWGGGTALQEVATGQADTVAEALSAHLAPTTILFGALGGGLGILEAGLPAAVRAAGKVVDAAYERAPAFGRRSLAKFWEEAPGMTRVMPETAEAMLAERQQLVALDERVGNVMNALSTQPPEATAFALANARQLEEVATATATGQRTVLDMLTLPAPAREASFANLDSVVRLQEATEGKALAFIREMPADKQQWFLENAQRLADATAVQPNAMDIFATMVDGTTTAFQRDVATRILDNFPNIMFDATTRNTVIDAMEDSFGKMLESLQGSPGRVGRDMVPSLEREAYRIARGVERESLIRIGEPGGPPSLSGIHDALINTTADINATARELAADPVKFSPAVARRVDELAEAAGADFMGVRPVRPLGREFGGFSQARHDAILADPVQAMERFKELRSKLGALDRELRTATEIEQKWAQPLVTDLYQKMTATFHDAAVWGEAASIRNMVDSAFSRMLSAYEPGGQFAQKFVQYSKIGGEKKAVIKRTGFNTYINQVGDPRTTGGGALLDDAAAMTEFTAAYENLVDVMRQVQGRATSTVETLLDTEVADFAARALRTSETANLRAAYTREWNMAQLRLQSQGGGRLPGITGGEWRVGSANLGGFPHGVPTASSPAAAALPPSVMSGIGAVPGVGTILRAGESLVSLPTWKAQVTSRIQGMAVLERRARMFQASLERGTEKMMRALSATQTFGRPVVGPIRAAKSSSVGFALREGLRQQFRPAAGAAEGARPAPPPREEREAARIERGVDDRIRRAHQLMQNPEEFARLMDDQSFAVAGDLPETTREVQLLSMRALQVLASAAPMPSGMALDSYTWSPAQRAQFQRIEAVVADPTRLLDMVADGTVTRAEVEAVDKVYPRALTSIRAQVMGLLDRDRAEGKPLSASSQRSLEALLGVPLSVNSKKASVQRFQEVFTGARRGESERPSETRARPNAGAKALTLGRRQMTDQQRANNRGGDL